MHDIKAIRRDPDGFDDAMRRRGLEPQARELLLIDETHRGNLQTLELLRAQRNEISADVAQAKKEGKDDIYPHLIAKMSQIKAEIPKLESDVRKWESDLREKLEILPNIPADDVPDGANEDDNEEVGRWGTVPEFAFPPRQHFELGEALGSANLGLAMDFEMAARLSGARFVVLRGWLARLERALACFMLDLHTGEHGYTETTVPALVRGGTAYHTGQLPKFGEDLFETRDDRWLIPTAEVPLTAQMAEMLVDEAVLPLRFCAWTSCFRREAGAAGRDTRGMMRQHQFNKVELVSITAPDQSMNELERMRRCAETVLERLELPYRTMVLCTGDMGFSAAKTYDVEVWLPGEGRYREISSCSNCTDFQMRRMGGRMRKAGSKPVLLHALNASGLAVGRTMIALLENCQNEDGSVRIPNALQPYMGGMETLNSKA